MPVELLTDEERDHRQKYILDELAAAPPLPFGETLLPFFHSCKGKVFRSILSSACLKTSICDVFTEDIVYLFYGKPAYRISGDIPTKDRSRYPVCFIINTIDEDNISRIFPFDTGALSASVFEDICGDETNPLKYEFGNTISDIEKFVSYFYGSQKNYFFTSPQKNPDDLNPLAYELAHVLTMIRDASDSKWDSRGYTIETQYKADFMIAPGNIRAIILPSSFLNDPNVIEFLHTNGIEPVEYHIEKTNSQSATDILLNETRRYLGENGLI